MRISLDIEPDVPADSQEYMALINALTSGFLVQVPLTDLRYAQTQTAPPVYQYEFTTVDARTWNQMIHYQEEFSGEPVLSLPANRAPTDRWTPTELSAHMAFCAILIALTRKFGVTRVHLQWEASGA